MLAIQRLERGVSRFNWTVKCRAHLDVREIYGGVYINSRECAESVWCTESLHNCPQQCTTAIIMENFALGTYTIVGGVSANFTPEINQARDRTAA